MRRGIPALGMVALAGAALLGAGCGLQRQQQVFFAPSNVANYVLFGQVTRAGGPIAGKSVKLYSTASGALLDSLLTDATGGYGFPSAPSGEVMVKVSSDDSLDFAYVRYIFTRSSSVERDSIPPMDLRAYGCAAIAPVSGARVPVPSPNAPLAFSWTPMSVAGTIKYRARLADAADSTVWESTRDIGTSALFNGIGTFGAYAGMLLGPGEYQWRVKVRFPTGVTAATRQRPLIFTSGLAGAPR
ncbi:MAG: hypothetical protein HZC42_05790 [Candidatus Eisenbacteria bacterium]|nr:hypothetical protein [Candidatus Eisenbacteria bacterium]